MDTEVLCPGGCGCKVPQSAVDAVVAKRLPATSTTPVDGEQDADEHHTMDELYQHRHALFIALLKSHRDLAWCSHLHDDGTMYDGWFIAGMDLPTGVISYHLPSSYFGELDDIAILERAPKWDGYTPADVIQRLLQYEPAATTPPAVTPHYFVPTNTPDKCGFEGCELNVLAHPETPKHNLAVTEAGEQEIDFSCRVCGVRCDSAPDPPARAVCPEHCEDHDYRYERNERGTYCFHCGQQAPEDWHDD